MPLCGLAFGGGGLAVAAQLVQDRSGGQIKYKAMAYKHGLPTQAIGFGYPTYCEHTS